ncbi:hypothetical protein FPQ18DRAFT_307048 [Pyronema domesticum]|nr:hypothetical protein FPQ18DRAFT_307048 [Pyronema domesticum]
MDKILAILERGNYLQTKTKSFKFEESLATSHVDGGTSIKAVGSVISNGTFQTCWTKVRGLNISRVDNIGDILLPIPCSDTENSSKWFRSTVTHHSMDLITEETMPLFDHRNMYLPRLFAKSRRRMEKLEVQQPEKRLIFTPGYEYAPEFRQPVSPERRLTVFLLGYSGTGKSELIGKPLHRGKYPVESYKTRIMDGEFELLVRDCIGRAEHREEQLALARSSDACILTYRIDMQASWHAVVRLAERIEKIKPDRKRNPIIIFQNQYRRDISQDDNRDHCFVRRDVKCVTNMHRDSALRSRFEFVVGDSRDSGFVYEMFQDLAKTKCLDSQNTLMAIYGLRTRGKT